MNTFIHLLKNTIKHIGHLLGASTNKEEEVNMDAICFPQLSEQEVVEDHELAAYHNQA